MKRLNDELLAIIAGTAITSAIVITQPQAAVALTGELVNDIARDVTVLINGINPGSGAIIGKNGNTYYVLTAKHVVATEDEYTLITSDKKAHKIDYSNVKLLPGVDLAVVEFTSKQNYKVAKLANSNGAKEGATVFTSGWPNPGREIKERIRQFSQGNITARPEKPLADGYSIVYTNWTRAGMSGGPVLNTAGHLVGIHGRAEGEAVSALGRESGAPAPGKIGINLAIPTNTFLSLKEKAGIDLNLKVEKALAPVLTADYVAPEEPDERDKIENVQKVIANINNSLNTVDGVRNTIRRGIDSIFRPF